MDIAKKTEAPFSGTSRSLAGLHAYASGSGSLSFVVRDENGNPAKGQRPTAEGCIAYIQNKIETKLGHWGEVGDYVIINQGPLDRENHEHFEAVQKVVRLAPNQLLYKGRTYIYDPTQPAGHDLTFVTNVGGGRIEVSGSGNHGALGYFLRNEKVLNNPARLVWDSSQGTLAGFEDCSTGGGFVAKTRIIDGSVATYNEAIEKHRHVAETSPPGPTAVPKAKSGKGPGF